MTSSANADLSHFLRDEHHHQFHLVVYTQTDADVNQYICGGGLDLGLNEAGMEEARKLARRFKKNPLKLKRMIASPELRSIQMADILHDEMKVKLTLWRELTDQFMGEWEGKSIHPSMDLTHPPQGETYETFSLRVRKGLEQILQAKDSVVLVTHPRVAKAVFEWLGIGAEAIQRGTLYCVDLPPNGGIAHFREI